LSSRAEGRERVRGEYRFSSLVNQNKKAKICFVIYIAGFCFLKNLCYEVFAKQKKNERFRLYMNASDYTTPPRIFSTNPSTLQSTSPHIFGGVTAYMAKTFSGL
jgi:hypothetical protein